MTRHQMFADFLWNRLEEVDSSLLMDCLWYQEDEYECDICEDFDLLREQLRADWVKYGLTKAVIKFPEIPDVVFKIPFTGIKYFYWDEREEVYQYGSQKKYEYDYCEREFSIYKMAKEANVADPLARTDYLMTYGGVDIYISEYCLDYDDNFQECSDNSRKTAKTLCDSIGINSWDEREVTAFLVESYGEELATKFMHFVKTNDLSDFHEGNRGWTWDNRFKLIDYSSYLEKGL